MRTRTLLTALLLAAAGASTAPAASAIFTDPGFTGQTTTSEWDLFLVSPYAPDVTGNVGQITETTGNALTTSSGNLYSFSGPMRISLTAASPVTLGQVSVQIRLQGEDNPIESLNLSLEAGGESLEPASASEFFREEKVINGFASVDSGFVFLWDFSGRSVTDFEVTFDLAVHTSFVEARLDTTDTVPVTAVPSPVIRSFGMAAGTFSLTFATEPGFTYRAMWSGLPDGSWTELGAAVTGDGGDKTVPDPDAGSHPRRFYKVVVSAP